MKVLWVCNIIPNQIAEVLKTDRSLGGGWITGTLNSLEDVNDIEIAVSFPQGLSNRLLKGQISEKNFYGFPASKIKVGKYDKNIEKWFYKIIEDYRPDIIHIWGTEFAHSLAAARAFACPERTICSIQGVCSAIAMHYRSGLSMSTVYGWTVRDILKLDNVWMKEKQFWQRGKIEKKTLETVSHVIGRTEFDMACTKAINQDVTYHHCDETLRDIFYVKRNSWKNEECEKHSIFVTSSSYPIKGFHRVLEALPGILKRFPNAKVYVVGKDPREIPFYRISKYYSYIKRLIKRLQLEDKVIYTGWLDEEAICEQFLRANVFVSASSIENSSNSIGEAMILGVPIVASYVGGTMDILVDKKEGFLYQSDAPYMLAEYVCRIFEDENLAKSMGECASEHAMEIYDKQQNAEQLQNIYCSVYESSNK